MGKIYLIRHAEAEGNLYRRVHGWYDSPLTRRGLEQVKALENRFQNEKIGTVYSSDLRRAMTTAQAVAGPRALPVLTDPGLRELHMGIYEDYPIGEMEFSHAALYQLFRTRSPQWLPPEGESYRQACDRMLKAFFTIAQRHPREAVAVFSHGTAIFSLQAALRGLPPHDHPPVFSKNTAVSCYEVRGESFRILFENDASHLPPSLNVPSRPEIPLVHFRPIRWSQEEDFYRTARQDAWLAVHPDLLDFDGPGYLQEAREQSIWDPRAVQLALLGTEPVGLLQLATLSGAQAGVGQVPLLWIRKDLRRKGIGIQLLGQAVSVYRGMGRTALRLRCSPKNTPAQQFYKKYGFTKRGDVPGAQGSLDLLELSI